MNILFDLVLITFYSNPSKDAAYFSLCEQKMFILLLARIMPIFHFENEKYQKKYKYN